MPTTLVEVFNLALSSCGAEGLVYDPDENSREAALCRLWLPQVRDHILATAPWPSAIKHGRPLLNRTRGGNTWTSAEPAPGYHFAYTIPGDLILPWFIHSFQPFLLQGGFIHTNDELPIMAYIHRLTNPQYWDPQLTNAIIAYLAARIARPLTGSKEVVNEQFEIAAFHVEAAQVQAAEMMPQTPTETLPDWITARGYSTTASPRWFYPFQHLNPVAA